MKVGSTGAGRFGKPKRFLLLLLFCVYWTLTVYAAPLKFVQVTDLHLYDKDEGPANRTALIDCIQRINELAASGEHYDFVVVTGDIGIEGLLKNLYEEEEGLKTKEDELKKNSSLTAQQSKELDEIRLARTRIHLEINNKIIAAAREVAAILDRSTIRKWLFLPGNNDLIDEEIGTSEFYTRFIDELDIQLIDKKEIRDLTDNKRGPYISGSHVFIGFNNASFKNNDDPGRITDKASNQINPEEVRHRVSPTEASPLPLSPVGQKQKDYIAQVSQLVDRYPSSNVYILYHIPEIDDSHPVLNFNSDAANKRLLSMNEPYGISAWFVEGEVRRLWHDVVNKNQVKALLAGHFHDWRYETYEEGYRWMHTPPSLYGGVARLHICPPLAVKRQADTAQQARGFQVVSVDDAGITSVERWWYYSATHVFTTTAPGASVATEENAMKILEQLVVLVGHLAWPLVALLVLYVLRTQLRQLFNSLANRVADPSSEISVADFLSIKNNLAANSGRIESLALGLQVVGPAAPGGSPAAVIDPDDEDKRKLLQLANEYLTVNIPDHAARVRRKNHLATEVGNLIIQHKISRQWVADQDDEGLKVGLASAINAVPSEGDLELLLRVSERVTKLHVMYRIAVALGCLFQVGLATAADAAGAKAVLSAFMQKADDSLRRRIDQTQSIIDLAVNNPKPAA